MICYELDIDDLLKLPAQSNVAVRAYNSSTWDQEFKDYLRCTVS